MIEDMLYWVSHLDQTLGILYANFGVGCYAILFLIIFSETAFVIFPFLPGDSLLFAVGAISASIGEFSLYFFWGILMLAAILGNQCNYWIGKYLGKMFISMSHSRWRWLKIQKRVDQAQQFYFRHGGKALILSRFIPVLRSFAPFVAGIARMPGRHFTLFNIVGAVLWISSLLVLGFLFGSVTWVKEHFMVLVFSIIIVSLLPAGISFWKMR